MKKVRNIILRIFLALCLSLTCMEGSTITVRGASGNGTIQGTPSGILQHGGKIQFGFVANGSWNGVVTFTNNSGNLQYNNCTIEHVKPTAIKWNGSVVFTTDKTISANLSLIFGMDSFSAQITVDCENGTFTYEGGPVSSITVTPPPHTHSFSYSATGNTITATCLGDGDCDYKNNGITLTLNASDSAFDGSPKAATLDGYPPTAVANLEAKPMISYYASAGSGSTEISGSALSGAPTEIGNYVAQITWGGQTAVKTFSITPGTIAVAASDENTPYDGNPHGITVHVTNPASGTTVSYGRTEGTYDLSESPTITNVADSPLTVYYKVTAGNYADYTGSATVTINNASQAAPAAPTMTDRTTTSITLASTDGYEYSKDGTNWQTRNVFTGLTSGTSYTFYQRVAAVTNYAPSDASPGASFSTLPHTHDFTYSASGATITATCGDDCPLTDAQRTITISAPADVTYDGVGKAATLSAGYDTTAAFTTVSAISYTKNGSAYAGTPTEPGTYAASVTAGNGTLDATARVTFTITKAAPAVSSSPLASAITYGQTLANSTLTGGAATGIGSVAVPGTFVWKTPGTAPSVSDSNTRPYTVVFTPTDSTLYAPIETTVTLTVNPTDPEAPTGLTATEGQTLSNISLPAGWSWVNPSASVGSAGVHSFKADYTAQSDNYNDKTNVDLTVTVSRKNSGGGGNGGSGGGNSGDDNNPGGGNNNTPGNSGQNPGNNNPGNNSQSPKNSNPGNNNQNPGNINPGNDNRNPGGGNNDPGDNNINPDNENTLADNNTPGNGSNPNSGTGDNNGYTDITDMSDEPGDPIPFGDYRDDTYGIGNVRIEVECLDADGNTSDQTGALRGSTESILRSCLTEEEIQAVAEGKDVVIKLVVTPLTESIPDTDRQQIRAALEGISDEPLTLGNYLDLSVMKKVGDAEWTKVTELSEELLVTLDIARELWAEGRTFYVLRSHDGEVTMLFDIDDDPYTITIKTRLFSTYALVYTDSPDAPKAPNDEHNCFMHWIILAAALIGEILALLLRRREDKKKLLIGTECVDIVIMLALAIIGSCMWDWIIFAIGTAAIVLTVFLPHES